MKQRERHCDMYAANDETIRVLSATGLRVMSEGEIRRKFGVGSLPYYKARCGVPISEISAMNIAQALGKSLRESFCLKILANGTPLYETARLTLFESFYADQPHDQIEKLFTPTPKRTGKRGRKVKRRDYDVTITRKTGKDKTDAVRFYLFNNAKRYADESGVEYLRISNVERCSTRIYFQMSEDRNDSLDHKLHLKDNALSTSFTPNKNAREIYAEWYGNFRLEYNNALGLYYIDLRHKRSQGGTK